MTVSAGLVKLRQRSDLGQSVRQNKTIARRRVQVSQELDALLARVDDPALREDLRRSIDQVRAKRTFGLVFERHLPERVTLPSHPVRRGVKVVRRDSGDDRTFVVRSLRNGVAVVVAENETIEVPVEDLVVVAEFGEPIYPGLKHVGSVDRGGDKPAHVVINAENHHALEALRFTHAGRVDCIYIDPPYNTGARDWKYDNDYVDGEDAYRHSKWLAFMERRLLLAKELLNPDDSVLIVTIDEKEYLRLGMLLEQTFPDARIQMVSIVISPSGTSREGLSRVDEYAYFCFIGAAAPVPQTVDFLDDRPAGDAKVGSASVRWEWLLRGGGSWYRAQRPNLCYPVLLSDDGERIVGVGTPFHGSDEAKRPKEIDGHPAAWPVRTDGRLGIWRVDARRLIELVAEGFAYVSEASVDRGTWTIRYLLGGTVKAIRDGEVQVLGRGPRGQVLVADTRQAVATPKTVWKRVAHIAGGGGGTQMLTALLGDRNRFPFPKSLYAVEDSLRIAVGDKPDAVILDFFSGSGTTAHAATRLNKQDGGRRQSISVTNNEVSPTEAKALTEAGFRDGDQEWEALGIFEHITRPRITAAMTGRTPEGEPIKGDYKFTDEFPMADGFEENVEFFELTYEDVQLVDADRAFEAIAPLLWLRAGGQGPILYETRDPAGRRLPYAIGERYAVLFNADRWRTFVAKLPDTVSVVFVVSDSSSTFTTVSKELPPEVEAVRLYRNYLSTFEIGRAWVEGTVR